MVTMYLGGDGVGGVEGEAGDRLVVAFLQRTAILGFIFEYIRPAIAQAFKEFRVIFEQVDRQTDQVIEVDCTTVGQGALVIGVDGQAHFGQRQRRRRRCQQVP